MTSGVFDWAAGVESVVGSAVSFSITCVWIVDVAYNIVDDTVLSTVVNSLSRLQAVSLKLMLSGPSKSCGITSKWLIP